MQSNEVNFKEIKDSTSCSGMATADSDVVITIAKLTPAEPVTAAIADPQHVENGINSQSVICAVPEAPPLARNRSTSVSSVNSVDDLSPDSHAKAGNYHAMDPEAVVAILETDAQRGLTTAEAEARLQRDGPNRLSSGPKRTILQMAWENFNNVVTYILLGAAIIAGYFQDWPDFVLILIVIIVNVLLGIIQEGRAEKATRAIASLVTSTALVLRNGNRRQIPAINLVKGDIVILSAGDRIPADVRFLECSTLQVTEASLTGESVPVTKNPQKVSSRVAIGDRICMGYATTLVFTGQGTAVVTAVGDNAVIGKINKLMTTSTAVKTPLLRKLNAFGRYLSAICVVLAVVTFLIAFFGRDYDVQEALQTAVSVAVALIPEGLGLVVTITLSFGVQAMARQNAIVRQLPAVETLGSVTVICSDKTGTLTRNEMTAVIIKTASRDFRVTGTGYNPDGDIKAPTHIGEQSLAGAGLELLRYLLLPAALCNDATLMPTVSLEAQKLLTTGQVNMRLQSVLPKSEPPTPLPIDPALLTNNIVRNASGRVPAPVMPARGPWHYTGDPTEAALLAVAMKSGLTLRTLNELSRVCERIDTLPFTSEHKCMATLHDVPIPAALLAGNGADWAGSTQPDEPMTLETRRFMFVKGAPEVVIHRCSTQAVGDNPWFGEPCDENFWLESASELSKQGLRVLALAHMEVPSTQEVVTSDMILKGRHLRLHCLIGIIDPPREDATAAVAVCQNAGIEVCMITGDSPDTAKTIAGWMGIANSVVVTGAELQRMKEEELEIAAKTCRVFARASPEDKIRIVRALKRLGHVVSMTGDGVNDAPALKAADVGVAMGIAGTEVAKEASKIILADDNFATIAEAVRRGRGVFANIVKQLYFLLPTSMAQGLSIAAAIVIGVDSPLTAIQVLWVNMITAATLGIVIGVEKPEPGVMDRPPRDPSAALVGKRFIGRVLLIGLTMIVAVLGNAEWTRALADPGTPAEDVANEAHTVALNTLVVMQALYCISCRFEYDFAFTPRSLVGNPWLTAMVILNAALQCLITYTPGLQPIFDTAAIDGLDWLRVLALAFAVVIVAELEKKVAKTLLLRKQKRQAVVDPITLVSVPPA